MEVILDFSTLRGTKPRILTHKRRSPCYSPEVRLLLVCFCFYPPRMEKLTFYYSVWSRSKTYNSYQNEAQLRIRFQVSSFIYFHFSKTWQWYKNKQVKTRKQMRRFVNENPVGYKRFTHLIAFDEGERKPKSWVVLVILWHVCHVDCVKNTFLVASIGTEGFLKIYLANITKWKVRRIKIK